nr:hypothetical protein [Tanacetum cinerariifolium]
MSSFNQRKCLRCGQPCDGLYCYPCTCQQYGVGLTNGICLNCTYRDGKPLICCECEGPLRGGFCWFCDSRAETSFTNDPNPNYFDDSQNLSDYPPQPQYETYPCELCGNDSHYGYDCPPRFSLDPEDSLIMGNEELNAILEKELDEFIKSSVEDLIPILEKKAVTFSNPLFNSNDDFTSSGDKSLSDKEVPEDKVKSYSNPLFEFDDEYIFSDVNPLFDEVLENIESKDSYDSNLDEPDLLVTPLFDSNEDEYFTPGDDVELLLHHDPSIHAMSVPSILEGFTDEPPLEENDNLFYLEPKNDDWKKILYDAPILMTNDKIFDPWICEKIFSRTYDYPSLEASRACGFVHRPLELQSLAYGNLIS